jgi:hypothetical protein
MEGRMRQRKERRDVNINKVMKERRKRKGRKVKKCHPAPELTCVLNAGVPVDSHNDRDSDTICFHRASVLLLGKTFPALMQPVTSQSCSRRWALYLISRQFNPENTMP